LGGEGGKSEEESEGSQGSAVTDEFHADPTDDIPSGGDLEAMAP
jgi:hypothetical protein